MNLGHRSADVLLGLLVVGVATVLLVALVFTQGWNERRFDVLMLTESAEELDPGTKVLLEGLEIGRVTRVIPRPNPASQTMEFLATLRLRSRFPDGSELQLPLGTRAEITVYNLKATDITLRLPAHWAGKVREGDTLRATRKQPPLDVMAGVADTLAAQLRLVLADSRLLMDRLTRTIDHADRELASTGPAVRTSLATFDTLLQQTNHSLATAGRILEQEGNRLGPMHDSLSAALSQARITMTRLDTLAAIGTAVASENRSDVHSTLIQLRQISVKMDYYLDQLGQKPMRMFTGIRPYPVDTGGPIR